MRYVPGLIPKEIKVLPDYFKGDVYSPSTKNRTASILSYAVAIIFFIAAIANIKHPLLTLLFGTIGFIVLPQGQRWMEQQFRFRLTAIIKSIFGGLFFVTAISMVGHYEKKDEQEAREQKIKTETEVANKLVADKKEEARRDSLNFYIQSAATLEKSSKVDEALIKLRYALNFAATETEKSEIANANNHILALKSFALVRQGKYQAAIPSLSSFLSADPNNSELLYNRAICYSKTGKIQEAINDLKPLLESGNRDANKLHEKINPLRKRVSYYVTRCRDGSTSDAKGRGACSHHGGVANWNEPVYEEYRKYE